jgi:general secretion pathway protein F
MPVYHYTALDRNGKTKKGVMEGDNESQIARQLQETGFTPIKVEHAHEQNQKTNIRQPSKNLRISTADLALVTRQLATLLAAGMPLEETLKVVAEQTEKHKIKALLLAVRAKVLEGYSLAKGMSEFPKAFSALYCATVAAGEQTGHLDAVLNRLAEYAEKQQYMKRKVQQALIYPAIMITVSLFIVTFLLLYVVPKMIAVFSTMNQALPGITLFLIGISQFVHHYGLIIVIFLIILGFAFHYLLKYEHIRLYAHQVLLKIPGIKHLIKVSNTARFIHTLGVLLAAGVSVIEALRISSHLVTNLPIRTSIEIAAKNIQEGANIHLALKKTGYFQAMSLHLIASGEASGQLEKMLEHAAKNQDEELEQIINTTLTLFEPLMILVMGAIVLFIVLAILLPIFSLDQFGG